MPEIETDSTTRPASRAATFDHHDPDLATRVFDEYAEIRSECPVGWSEQHGGFWVVTDWSSIHDLARDTEHLSSRVGLIPDMLGDNVLIPISLDPPEHSKYRGLLQRWFSPGRVATFEPFIRRRCRELLAAAPSRCDLGQDYARPLPLDVILMVLGVPDHDMAVVADGARAAIELAGADPVEAFAKIERAYTYLATDLVPGVRADPSDDLISFLAGAEIDGFPLDEQTIASIAFNVIGAGFDTTYKSISSAVAFLAAHPEHQAELREEADLGLAVEEMLRLFAPVSVGREVTQDVDCAGVRLRSGDVVLLAFPAAGRDPLVFADPDTPDFARKPNKHMTFGTGIHRCLGMHLARLELVVALEELFAATSTFELEPGRDAVFSPGQVWGATSVPVRLARDESAPH